jgi:hypothetical protein
MTFRTFRDATGIVWQVWEVHPTLAERRRTVERRGDSRPTTERRVRFEPRAITRADLMDGWLAFRSAHERRRRAPIPPDWESMTDDELSEIVRVAERAGGVADGAR